MNEFKNKRILIVEDRPEHDERLRKFLSQKELSFISALDDYGDENIDLSDESAVLIYLERINLKKIKKILNDYQPDLILLDLAWNTSDSEVFNRLLSAVDIMSIWKELKQNNDVPNVFKLIEYLDKQLKFIPVIILTDYQKHVKLIFDVIYKNRADHIIIKKPQAEWMEKFEKELWPEVKRCLNAKKFVDHAKELLIAASSSNINFFNTAMHAASSDASILIVGENGSGKTVLAKAIHEISRRAGKLFVNKDISSIPKDMAYTILFGHRKGIFTGAIEDKQGLLESAKGGTVFLDEIGDLPLDVQSTLLKVIEEKKISRLGEEYKEVPIDVRFIFATNKNLQKLIRGKFFREDFYYRINGLVLEIKPLRERKKDIPHLVRFFYNEYSKQRGGIIRDIREQDIFILQNYNFPGNIRQLLSIVKRAVILEISLEESLAMEERNGLEVAMNIDDVVTFLWSEMYEQELGLKGILEKIESQMIERALIKGHTNAEAAALLKLKLSTFEVKKSKIKKKENNHETNQL